MDPEIPSKTEKAKASLQSLLTPLKKLALRKNVPIPKTLPIPKTFPIVKKLPIPGKLVIPAIAAAVLLIAGGAVFGLLHASSKYAAAPPVKALASAPVGSAAGPSAAKVSVAKLPAACSGVVRDIYRQTVAEDPDVTLGEVRSEVLSSGVSCAPVPEIAAELKDLSPACRDMVQYTFLELRDSHAEYTVGSIREKVVPKSVACEHDRTRNIASVARRKAK